MIQVATESLVLEILINPAVNTVTQCIRNLLASFTKHRHVIHAGYTYTENGSWILQVRLYCKDYALKFQKFSKFGNKIL